MYPSNRHSMFNSHVSTAHMYHTRVHSCGYTCTPEIEPYPTHTSLTDTNNHIRETADTYPQTPGKHTRSHKYKTYSTFPEKHSQDTNLQTHYTYVPIDICHKRSLHTPPCYPIDIHRSLSHTTQPYLIHNLDKFGYSRLIHQNGQGTSRRIRRSSDCLRPSLVWYGVGQ